MYSYDLRIRQQSTILFVFNNSFTFRVKTESKKSMTSLKSGEVDSPQIRKKLLGNVLPTNTEVIEHFFHVRQILMVTDTKFSKKKNFNDLKDVVISDVVELWSKGSLSAIKTKSIHKKLKMLHQRFEVARKLAKKTKTFNYFQRLA